MCQNLVCILLPQVIYLAAHCKLYPCCCVQEAKALLKSLELSANEEQCTPVAPKDREDEEEPEKRRLKLRRKATKPVIPQSPPPSKGACSSHEDPSKHRVIQDTGEDAQPPFAPATPFMSTQKDIPETQKESSPEPKRLKTTSPEPPNTPKQVHEPSSPKASTPKSSRRKRKPSTPKPSTPKPATPKPSTPKPSTPKPSSPKPSSPKVDNTPKPSSKKLAATPEPSNRKPLATPKPSPRSPKPSSRKPPTSPEQQSPKPGKSPRKSLLTSFEQVSGPKDADPYVITLAAPETDSESGDEMLQHALSNMITVSSCDEGGCPEEAQHAL